MDAKFVIGQVLTISAVALSGCQSWSGATFPMQSQTRVPPPGTGTYQLPNGYYNNNDTSAVAPTGQVMQAGFSSGPQVPNGALPSTNLATQTPSSALPPTANNFTSTAQFTAPNPGTGNLNTPGSTPGVSSAGFNATGINATGAAFNANNGAAAVNFGSSPPPFGGNAPAGASLSDSQVSEVPSLQWQP